MMSRRTQRLWVSALVSIGLLLGSIGWRLREPDATLPCAALEQELMLDVYLDTLHPGTITAWATARFDLRDSDIIQEPRAPDRERITQSYTWLTPSHIRYQASFQGERLINLKAIFANPSLEEMVRCFGTPQGYQASYERGSESLFLWVSLWYPQQGLVLSHISDSASGRLPRLSQRTRFDQAIRVRAAEEIPALFADVYPDRSSETLSSIQASIRPWPDTGQPLVIVAPHGMME